MARRGWVGLACILLIMGAVVFVGLQTADQVASVVGGLVAAAGLTVALLNRKGAPERPAPLDSKQILVDLAREEYRLVVDDLAVILQSRTLDVPWSAESAVDVLTETAHGGVPGLVDVAERFDKVVIVGGAGAGKTVATRLFQRCMLADPKLCRVPVRFSLHSWNPERIGFFEWLRLVFSERFGGIGIVWTDFYSLLRRDELLLVLDGLDEVKATLQDRALATLFNTDLPMVITTRPLTLAMNRPPGVAVISLWPVDGAEVERYLSSEPKWAEIAAEVRRDSASPIGTVLSSPLMIWLVGAVYPAGAGASELLIAHRFPDGDAIEDHLLSNLVPSIFTRAQRDPQGDPMARTAPEDAERWLAFLARGVKAHGQIGFWTIETLAPMVGITLVIGAVLGIMSGLVALIAPVLGVGLQIAFPLGVCFGFAFGRGYTLARTRLDSWWLDSGYSGRMKHTSNTLVVHVRRVVVALAGALVASSCALVVEVLGRWASPSTSRALNLFADQPILLALTAGSVPLALLAGYVGGGIAGLIMREASRLDRAVAGAQAKDPADAVRKDRGSALVVAMLAWATTGVLLSASFTVAIGLDSAFAAAVGGLGAMPAAASVFTFWARYRPAHAWLAWRGKLPWSLMAFLAESHSLGILQQSGLFYEFRHVRLQETLIATDLKRADND